MTAKRQRRSPRMVSFFLSILVASSLIIGTASQAEAASPPGWQLPPPSCSHVLCFYDWLNRWNTQPPSDISFLENADTDWFVGLSWVERQWKQYDRSFCCDMRYRYNYDNFAKWFYLDWTTDGCSNAPDRMVYYNFTRFCIQHDFSYRNWKLVESFRRYWGLPNPDVWNSQKRLQIDQRFWAEMDASCYERPSWEVTGCRNTAYLWYLAIRQYGS